MPIVVGIVFKRAGKVYYFDPDSIDLAQGDKAVVKTSRGMEFGEVVAAPMDVPEEEITAPLKKVVRKATDEDREQLSKNKQKEKDAYRTAEEKIAKHKLPMKLIEVEYVFDGSKIIFYFTSDGRVDFRDLVKDLASVFKTRIELRQIGVRDEAKMVGGLGPCGQRLCCTVFLGDFEPVSIRMAKEQDLPLNPLKISGVCGRLMCCLKYEFETYVDFKKRAPRRGTRVQTEFGIARIVEYSVPKEAIIAELESGQRIEMPLADALQCVCKGKCREEGCGNAAAPRAELEDESDVELLKELEDKEQKDTGRDNRRGRTHGKQSRNFAMAEDVIDENEGFIDTTLGGEKAPGLERSDRSDRPGRPEKSARPDRPNGNRSDRFNKPDRKFDNRSDKPGDNNKPDSSGKPEAAKAAEGSEQTGSPTGNGKPGGHNHNKKDRYNRHTKHGKPNKPDKNKPSENGNKG